MSKRKKKIKIFPVIPRWSAIAPALGEVQTNRWVNGNHDVVIEDLKIMPPVGAALIVAFMTRNLPKLDHDRLLTRLMIEVDK